MEFFPHERGYDAVRFAVHDEERPGADPRDVIDRIVPVRHQQRGDPPRGHEQERIVPDVVSGDVAVVVERAVDGQAAQIRPLGSQHDSNRTAQRLPECDDAFPIHVRASEEVIQGGVCVRDRALPADPALRSAVAAVIKA